MFRHFRNSAHRIHSGYKLSALLNYLAIFVGMSYLSWQQFHPKSLSTTALLGKVGMLGPRLKFALEERPFQTMQGKHFDILRPWYDMSIQWIGVQQLLASPEDWVERLISRLQWLDPLTSGYDDRPQSVRARAAYLEVIKMHTSGLVYGCEERSAMPSGTTVLLGTTDPAKRGSGLDWTYLGNTMTGGARLNNLESLLEDVFLQGIPGDYIETGVWRGGSSIFARAVMRSYNEGHRMSYVCDSFRGLPPGDRGLNPDDKGWEGLGGHYLEVSANTVASNFHEMGLLDPNVVFAKGFFNDTLTPLSSQIQKLAIMRLDGDMYESTVDALYRLYDKLSMGGYVIIDDWFGFPAQVACVDFFHVHGINPEIIKIDEIAVYWQKTEEIEIQYWRYKTGVFRLDSS